MNYNEEYFYVKKTGGDKYPSLQYARGGGNSMEIFDDILLNTRETRYLCFRKPIPRNPRLADHHFMSEHAPVISERLKNVLESFNLKDVQFLPAVIQDKDGEEHGNYYIIHVVNMISCMDKEKSEWKPNKYKPEKAADVEKLILDNQVLDKIPLEDRLVFVLWEKHLKVLYHRSVIEKILDIEPTTGLTVYRLAKWDSTLPFIEEYMNKKLNPEEE